MGSVLAKSVCYISTLLLNPRLLAMCLASGCKKSQAGGFINVLCVGCHLLYILRGLNYEFFIR